MSHKKLPLNVIEFVPKFADLAGGISNLLAFLKLKGMGFVLKQCHINFFIFSALIFKTKELFIPFLKLPESIIANQGETFQLNSIIYIEKLQYDESFVNSTHPFTTLYAPFLTDVVFLVLEIDCFNFYVLYLVLEGL